MRTRCRMIHACSSQSTHMRNTWQNKVTALVEHDCVIQRGRRVAGIRSRPVRHEFVHTLCHAPVVHVSDTRIAAEWPRCVFDECGADVEVCSDVTDGHVVRQALLHHALPHVLRERQRHRRASGAEEQMLESAERRTYVNVSAQGAASGCTAVSILYHLYRSLSRLSACLGPTTSGVSTLVLGFKTRSSPKRKLSRYSCTVSISTLIIILQLESDCSTLFRTRANGKKSGSCRRSMQLIRL